MQTFSKMSCTNVNVCWSCDAVANPFSFVHHPWFVVWIHWNDFNLTPKQLTNDNELNCHGFFLPKPFLVFNAILLGFYSELKWLQLVNLLNINLSLIIRSESLGVILCYNQTVLLYVLDFDDITYSCKVHVKKPK